MNAIRRANSDTGPFNKVRKLAADRRVSARNMDELIGMCRMVLSDGAVDDHEAQFLLKWIETHYHAANEWPGNILYARLTKALVGGHICKEEESELLEALAQVAGGPPSSTGPCISGAIPFEAPEPAITFQARGFVLTGQFASGTRAHVTDLIVERGGTVAESVSKKCHYLVVGTFGSEEWLHSTHGLKIMKAVELKAEGARVQIVTEKHWAAELSTKPTLSSHKATADRSVTARNTARPVALTTSKVSLSRGTTRTVPAPRRRKRASLVGGLGLAIFLAVILVVVYDVVSAFTAEKPIAHAPVVQQPDKPTPAGPATNHKPRHKAIVPPSSAGVASAAGSLKP